MAIGRQSELRYYNDYPELASALIGEVRAQPSLLDETAMAKAVLRTPAVATDLRSVATRIVTYWDGIQAELNGPDPSWTNYLLGYSQGDYWNFIGSYLLYHKSLTPLSGLKKCNANKIDVNIALIHDMMEFIKSKAGEDHLYRPLQWTDPRTMAQRIIEKRDMRNNLGTVNENYPVVQHGRALRYHMQAGPSFTVSQMLTLCKVCDATQGELTSVAYAIFAFWNQVYKKACTPIHTYYEVMVAAANFGVPFNSMRGFAHNLPIPILRILNQIRLFQRVPPLV